MILHLVRPFQNETASAVGALLADESFTRSPFLYRKQVPILIAPCSTTLAPVYLLLRYDEALKQPQPVQA
jgi:hypothetical protein